MSEFIDGLHLVLMIAVVVLMVINWKLHDELKDASLHLKMAAFTIAAFANGEVAVERRGNGEYVITRKEVV